jgi:hypothetical protein
MERAVTTVVLMQRLDMQSGSRMRRILASLIGFLRPKPKPTNEPNSQRFIEQL